MTIAANDSLEIFIKAFGDRVINLKTENVRFPAIETESCVTHLLAAHFNTPGSRDGFRIFHTLASGLT
jgi:hypothetical protein